MATGNAGNRVTLQAFLSDATTRSRSWARSLVGWKRFGRARPKGAHAVLAKLGSILQAAVELQQSRPVSAPNVDPTSCDDA